MGYVRGERVSADTQRRQICFVSKIGDHKVDWARNEKNTQLGCLHEIRSEMLERETGFEPATFCLGSRHSAS